MEVSSMWWKIQLVLVLVVAFAAAWDGSVGCSLAEETTALLNMAKSFTLTPDSWRSIGTDWEGIKCDSRTGEVVELKLSGEGFQGGVSDHICELKNLRSLTFDCPALDGYIPDCIWNLTGLQFLSTGFFNRLRVREGRLPGFMAASNLRHLRIPHVELAFLPSWISSLSELRILDLSQNNLQSIPPSITQLTKLRELSLELNQIVYIPSSISGLGSLKTVNLYGNRIQAITSSFNDMEGLKSLDLGNNPVQTITKSFSNAPNLQSLYLDKPGTGVLHAITSSFNHLPSLHTIDLSENDIHVIYSSFNNLSSLRELYLDRNFLSGFSESISFTGLPILQLLNLSSNNIEAIPETFCDLPSLLRLDLSNNDIRALPAFFGRLSSLMELHLSHNNIKDTPLYLGNITKLEILNLGSNKLPRFSATIGNLSSLRTLSLSNNTIHELENFTDAGNILPMLESFDLSWNGLRAIPEAVSSLSGLLSLQLSHNRIQFLSHSLDNVSTLISADISSNRLRGRIPEDLTWLSRLSCLNLANNQFTGRIPSFLFNLSANRLGSSTYSLDLSSNLLTGGIPNWICSSSHQPVVVLLDLSFNRLEGSLYSSLDDACVDYKTLRLSNNYFSGGIPADGFINSHPRILDFSSNRLNGTIPQTLGDTSYLTTFLARNNLLSGSLSQTFLMDDTFLSNAPNVRRLQALDLSNNLLSGPIPRNFMVGNDISRQLAIAYDAPGVVYLNLSNNRFSGCVPDSMGMLTQLQFVDLSANNLSGEIPPLPFLQFSDLSRNYPTSDENCLPPRLAVVCGHDNELQRILRPGWLSPIVLVVGFPLFLLTKRRRTLTRKLHRLATRTTRMSL